MKERAISRWAAGGVHLAGSVLIAAAVLALIYFLWYPGGLFNAAGGRELFLIIASVDVVAGPLMTAIVFRQGKKGLEFDLVVIAAIQVLALFYGAWVLYESRPAWIVFVVDRFELVRANQVLEPERAKAVAPFNELPLVGPLLAGARQPQDPGEQFRIALSAAQGFDLPTYPQYLVAYDEVRSAVLAHAQPLSMLGRLNPAVTAEIAALPAKFGRRPGEIGFIPMRAGKFDGTVLVDLRTGDYLGTSAFKPWDY
jgi:hypothetical protein